MRYVQPDLFGYDDAARRTRLVGALEALRDEDPHALEVLVLSERTPKLGGCRAGFAGGRYAYGPQLDGYHWEDVSSWPGWHVLPANVVRWDELDELVAGRLGPVRAWAESLTAPDRWCDYMRPYEMWPHPDRWHPDRVAHDHARPGWPARAAAWNLLRDLLTQVVREISAELPPSVA